MGTNVNTTTHPAANPAHPAHASFNWGIFLGLLAVGLSSASQVISPQHPTVGAALAGGSTVLGTVDQAVAAATAAPAPEVQPEAGTDPELTS